MTGRRETPVALLSLNAAIDGIVERGIIEPKEIADAILRDFTEDYLRNVFWSEAHEIISMRAQYRHGVVRRSIFRATDHRGQKRTEKYGADVFFGTPIYVPTVGWKTNGELTKNDCLAVAAAYRKRADDMVVWADRYSLFAQLMKKQRVLVLAEVKGIEAIEELAA